MQTIIFEEGYKDIFEDEDKQIVNYTKKCKNIYKVQFDFSAEKTYSC